MATPAMRCRSQQGASVAGQMGSFRKNSLWRGATSMRHLHADRWRDGFGLASVMNAFMLHQAAEREWFRTLGDGVECPQAKRRSEDDSYAQLGR